jgi:outer membrane receptor protein involved in Fe transport
MTQKWGYVSVFVALLFCMALSSSAYAQGVGGTISGTVLDPGGAAVPGAQIVILNPAVGQSRTLTSNETGFFSAPNLVPANYVVTTSATGFATLVEKVELKVGMEAQLNLQLKVGDVSEKVVVEGGTPNIETTTSTLIATVEGKTIRELPLNGRDWTQLAALEPGVHTIDTQTINSLGNTGRVNRGWGSQLTVGGARPQQNNYRLDGISINDYSGGGPGNTLGALLGVEAIQEYSVVSFNPTGEYGKTSGGVFNAVTRSGTNDFHGSAFEFHRNSKFDARNFFDGATAPPFNRNQFGFAIGGPIYVPRFGEGGKSILNGRNRSFFFFNYEGLREGLSTTTLNTVPSRAAREGRLVSGTVTVNPKVRPYLALFPLPTGAETGDTGIAAIVQDNVSSENFYTFRLDHKLSEADSIRGTYLNDKSTTSGPDPLNTYIQANFSKRKMVSIEETHIFSPTLLNTARIGYSRVVATGPTTTQILNPLLDNPSLGFLPGQPIGVLTVSGLTRISGNRSQEAAYIYNSFQAYDDLFKTMGNHSLKAGASIEYNQLNQSTTSSPNGGWAYGSLRNFLTNGAATSFITTVPGLTTNPTYLRQKVFGFYGQDDWRMRDNLTLNLGLRYEPTTVPTEKYNRLATLTNLTDAKPKLGSPFYKNPTLLNFSPRFGFAWDPFRNGKTSVRGGFGIYDTLPLLYQVQLSTLLTAPYFQSAVINPVPSGLFPTGGLGLVTPEKARVTYVQQDPPRSYVEQWNLSVQREVPMSLVIQAGYTGSHGVHQPYKTQDADFVFPNATPDGLFFPLPRGGGRRINENVGQINGTTWQASSVYHALNVRVSRRTQQTTLGVSYTWAKSIDNNSASVSGGQFTNSINGLPVFFSNLWRGLSDFDVRHSIVANYLWEVPRTHSKNDFVRTLVDGWQWGGIVRAQTGVPFTATISGDSLGMNSNNSFNFPDRVNSPECKNPINPGNVTNYIKTECFVVANPVNRMGNAGRNTLTGPGLFNVDMSLYKNNYIRSISETFNVQIRVEAFNVLNHTNFRPPAAAQSQIFTFASAGGGTFTRNAGAGLLTLTSTNSRQIQFAVKVIW